MKKIIALLFMMTMLLAISGCKKENNTKLRVGLMKGLLSVPYFFAEEEKIFEKYGINVQLELYGSAKDRDAAFYGKKIDAVSTDLVAALLYMNNNKEIVITSQTEEEFRLVRNNKILINSIEDIEKYPKEINIAVSENTVIEYLVDTVMKKHNVTNYEKKNISIVPDRYQSVVKGETDMTIMPEPFPSLVIEEGGKELWKNTDENIFATCFVVDKNFAEANYKIIKNFNLAINEAIEKMMSLEYIDYQDTIVNNGVLSDDDLKVVNEQIFHPLVLPKEETFLDALNWAKNKGLINKDYDLNNLLYPYILEKL